MASKNNWTQCMLRMYQEDPTLSEDELRELCEYEYIDDIFDRASEDSEKDSILGDLLASLLIGTTLIDLLSPAEQQVMELTDTTIGDITENGTIPDWPTDLPELLDEELRREYEQLMEEIIQQGRIEDPNTVEYKDWENQEQIADMMGMFGDLEADKLGELNIYTGLEILIPWETAGDDVVCEDCADLESDGPYPPDEFPEPPHYGCRCNKPFPEPIINY